MLPPVLVFAMAAAPATTPPLPADRLGVVDVVAIGSDRERGPAALLVLHRLAEIEAVGPDVDVACAAACRQGRRRIEGNGRGPDHIDGGQDVVADRELRLGKRDRDGAAAGLREACRRRS